MSQPSFWLKVSKKYVIENFESLLEYINHYEYSPGEKGQSDFEESVRCLAETASDLAGECRKIKIWQRPELEVDLDTAVRIMAASVLARKKMGVDDHDGVLNLIELLLASGQQLTPDEARSLLRLTIDCMCQRPFVSPGFSFNSISADNFMPGAFPSLLAATEIGDDKGRRAEFEGKGCLEVSADGIVAAPMNLDTFRRIKYKPTLDSLKEIRIVEHDEKRPTEVEEMLDYYGMLSNLLDRVTPSPVKMRQEYPVGAQMYAEVIYCNGYDRIMMRTVSPDYRILEGRLYVPKFIMGYIPRLSFFSQVKEGYVFKVERSDQNGFTFVLSNDHISEFMSYYSQEMHGSELWAVFVSHFRTGEGTRWLTEDGFQVNVGWSVPEGINTSVEAPEKVAIKMKGLSTDNTGKLIFNAEFKNDDGVEVEECDVEQFREDAYKEFCACYIEWCNSDEEIVVRDVEEIDRVGSEPVVIAGRLLETMADDPGLSTPERIEYLTMAMMLLKMAGREDGDAYVRHRLDYLRAIADFASGASPISLKLQRPEELRDVEESRLRDSVIVRLRDYKEQEITHAESMAGQMPGRRHIDADTPEVIRQLVDASNILIDKIDSAEIHRIKKSIASRLGVGDCYRNAYDDLPYYGDENETMEFKQSCVTPPANRRTTSATKDFDVQKYAILKGVLAFLNSPQGGDLLVGVADSGYASGLKEDIAALYSAHVISEPTADRVRIYLKNAIDKAFVTLDGSMSGSAITADCVSCNIEAPRDNIEVLRIKVKPFPWDVVKFADSSDRPEGLAEVYSRTSGASTPMSSDGIRGIKLRKSSEIGRENIKMLPIMEAIDEHRCVLLRGYASSNGISDRKIEPHRILFDLKAVQAFDLQSRSMKLFKLHRIESVERTGDRWKNENLHRDLAVDIFGMMQQEESAGERVVIKLTDYALSLLREEFSGVGNKAEIVPNKAQDRDRFGWRLTTRIYNPAGIGRFILGLRREIEVVEGQALKDYIANY